MATKKKSRKTAARVSRTPKAASKSTLGDLVRKHKSLGNTWGMFPVAEVAKLLN